MRNESGNKVSRSGVYAIINEERDYQNKVWNESTTPTNGFHTVAEYLVYLQDYLTEAVHVSTRNADPLATELTLGCIRKITAMGVACMEQNGVVARV